MEQIERALEIAREAHSGQLDKGGVDYIEHPIRVAKQVDGSDRKIVALLHDVVEDCPDWTFERLRAEGFPDHVVDALEGVTRCEGEDYDAFIRRAAQNPISKAVKIADLQDNSDVSRLPTVAEADRARIGKYQRALAFLQTHGVAEGLAPTS